MPPARKKPANGLRQPISPEEKIARLLGMILVKDVEQRMEQVSLLRSAGFEVAEVAAMLGITENHVNVAAHKSRKTASKKKVKD